MRVPIEKKIEFWDYYTHKDQKHYRPVGVTDKRLERARMAVFNNEGLWADVVARHGGLTIHPSQMDKFTFEHSIGNFYGMVVEIMFKTGVLK